MTNNNDAEKLQFAFNDGYCKSCENLAAEVVRLRGLLREAHLALSFIPDPTRKLLDLRYRVREALGE